MPLSDESAVDINPLTPPPAPLPMPARQMRTVGSLLISAMSGVALLGPAPLAQRAVVPAVENSPQPH
ncbi:MAG: hypothetical protein P1U88_17510 [Thalassobaculaceae bacterium]|nr:hypothetical protein [Thalassobaculaceae bacterium]